MTRSNYRLVWRHGKTILIRTALAGALLAGFAQFADAAAATLNVVNTLSEPLVVNVDQVYGCNPDSGTTCSIPVSQGHHSLDAKTASGKEFIRQADIGAQGYTWTVP